MRDNTSSLVDMSALGLLLTGAAEQRLDSAPQSICALSLGLVATGLFRRALGPGHSSMLVDLRTAEFCAKVALAAPVAGARVLGNIIGGSRSSE